MFQQIQIIFTYHIFHHSFANKNHQFTFNGNSNIDLMVKTNNHKILPVKCAGSEGKQSSTNLHNNLPNTKLE